MLLIPKRYRQTDGRHAISLPRSALASRGKNLVFSSPLFFSLSYLLYLLIHKRFEWNSTFLHTVSCRDGGFGCKYEIYSHDIYLVCCGLILFMVFRALTVNTAYFPLS